jgi:dihydrodipicolinate synthase/N-acetylneuraminate lyase
MNSSPSSPPAFPSLVWSASPTPFTEDAAIDQASVARTIERHVAIGCDGVMLGGTCGEGPWLTSRQFEALVKSGVEAAQGNMPLVFQATENSSGKVLEKIEDIARWGGQMAVVAQPFFLINARPEVLRKYYTDIFDHSPLPLAFYDRGASVSVPVPQELLEEVASHPKVRMVKDSSCDARRSAALKTARDKRPGLVLLTGDEFQLIPALEAGFDGAFFGGAIATAVAVRRALTLWPQDPAAARALDLETQSVLFSIYGGRSISCWLSGLKYLLVCLGVFSGSQNLLGYELTPECKEEIDLLLTRYDWLHA